MTKDKILEKISKLIVKIGNDQIKRVPKNVQIPELIVELNEIYNSIKNLKI